MKIDDLIDENTALKQQNTELFEQLLTYRKSIWSLQNILNPEQQAIIKHDLINIQMEIEEYAQHQF